MILFKHLYIWVVRQAIFANGREIYDSNCVSETQGVKELSIDDVPVVSQPERLRSCLIWGGIVVSVARVGKTK